MLPLYAMNQYAVASLDLYEECNQLSTITGPFLGSSDPATGKCRKLSTSVTNSTAEARLACEAENGSQLTSISSRTQAELAVQMGGSYSIGQGSGVGVKVDSSRGGDSDSLIRSRSQISLIESS